MSIFRKVVAVALFLSIVILGVLYMMSRNSVLRSSSKWRSQITSASSRLHTPKKHIMLLNGTALHEDWLLAAVDNLPFRTMTPSLLLLEDLYFTPNYNIQVDYSSRLLLEPNNGCSNSPELLVLVPSEPKSSTLRKAIRETWGSVGRGKKAWPWRVFNTPVCLLFVLGVEGENVQSNDFELEMMHESGGRKTMETDEALRRESKVRMTKDKHIGYGTIISGKQKRETKPFHITRQFTPSMSSFQSTSNRYITKESMMAVKYQILKKHSGMKTSKNSSVSSSGKRTPRSNAVSQIELAKVREKSQHSTPVIIQESERFNDILQFDMVDSYKNLTRKLLLSMQWVSKYLQGVKYIMKADQDVFVNIPLIATFLKNYGEENSVYGNIYANSWVERKGRWAVPNSVVPIPKYPIYAAGNAYVLSADSMSKVLNMSVHFPYVPVEDAFITGILSSVCGVNRVNVAGFTRWTESQPDPCDFVNDKRYVGNNYTEHSFRITWRELIDRGSGRCED